MVRKFAIALACTGATVLGVAAAPAQAITIFTPTDYPDGVSLIDQLVNTENKFKIGDKLFSEFSCTNTSKIGTTFGGCESLTVFGLIENSDNIVLRFAGGLQAGPDGTRNSLLDVLLGYTVEVLDSKQAIKEIDLRFNGALGGIVDPSNLPTASVTETVFKYGGPIIGQLGVSTPFDKEDPPIEISRGDLQLTEAVKKARVVKDVLLTAPKGQSYANISFIDQSFHQKETKVPEPGAVAGLLVFGSFGVGLMLKRQRQNSNKLTIAPTSNDNN